MIDKLWRGSFGILWKIFYAAVSFSLWLPFFQEKYCAQNYRIIIENYSKNFILECTITI